MSLSAQLTSVASEVSRYQNFAQTGNFGLADASLCRALELMDATVDAATGTARKRGLLRLRSLIAEVLLQTSPQLEVMTAIEHELAPFAVRFALERGV